MAARKMLPRKLSALLQIAIDDAQTCELNPAYTLSMGVYHVASDSKCHVCMAGAVMAQTLRCDPSKTLVPGMEGMRRWEKRLYAIDDMRRGEFLDAAGKLGRRSVTLEQAKAMETASKIVDYRRVTANPRPGREGRSDWYDYQRAIDVLKEAGL